MYILERMHQEDIHYQMAKLYTEIKNIRYNIAHAGFLEDNSFNEYIDKANDYCKKTKQLVFCNQQLPSLIKELPIYTFVKTGVNTKS